MLLVVAEGNNFRVRKKGKIAERLPAVYDGARTCEERGQANDTKSLFTFS